MVSKHLWSKQLFIAVESELQRPLKRYGIKGGKPDEKFIKTVQKAAAAKGMTVAEYKDKILFPLAIPKIIRNPTFFGMRCVQVAGFRLIKGLKQAILNSEKVGYLKKTEIGERLMQEILYK